MNNKPVAWMLKTGHGTKILEVKPYCEVDLWTPLYTHPADLTDEEIMDFINAFCLDMGDCWDLNEKNAIPMIRAILRKASEVQIRWIRKAQGL